MEKIENNKEEMTIVLLFLEKLEKMNEKERATIIKVIDILNHPVFISKK